MNKVKVLGIVSLGLLLANIVLIWFLLSHKPPHPKRENPKKVIVEKLHLDKQQTNDYEKLIQDHQGNIQKSEQQIALLKNQLYSRLNDEQRTNEVDSLIAEIGKVQINIEQIHYNHFLDIKNLCKPEQLKDYNELTSKIANLFTPLPLRNNENH
ncbi:MAG: periplasmic heavy metal sensor [Saprospiraceae bacterium]|nr:periplasmic heavy metal sensor [Saprospiraceae bacterium]